MGGRGSRELRGGEKVGGRSTVPALDPPAAQSPSLFGIPGPSRSDSIFGAMQSSGSATAIGPPLRPSTFGNSSNPFAGGLNSASGNGMNPFSSRFGRGGSNFAGIAGGDQMSPGTANNTFNPFRGDIPGGGEEIFGPKNHLGVLDRRRMIGVWWLLWEEMVASVFVESLSSWWNWNYEA